MSNIFEKAIREKLRFHYKGVVSVEDLWDLDIEELDSIYKSINSFLQKQKEDSLLDKKSKKQDTLELKIEIIKYIVRTKQKEIEEKEKALTRKQEREKLLSIIEEKEDEKLKNMSIDELKKRIERID